MWEIHVGPERGRVIEKETEAERRLEIRERAVGRAMGTVRWRIK